MIDTEKSENFIYWRRPWQKWLVLIAGILQLINLSLNVQEYKDIAKVGIFSSYEWESYAVQQSFVCALNGLTAAIFLGIFLIGIFARSQKVGSVLQITSQSTAKIIWGLLLVATFGGSIYTFWRGGNSQ